MKVRLLDPPHPGAPFLSSQEWDWQIQPGRLCLIIGGSKSGKSRFAETAAEETAAVSQAPLYYLATMIPGEDPENQRRIARHRRQRAGKGYISLEYPKLSLPGNVLPGGAVVLLDCLGNLLANELFDEARVETTQKEAEGMRSSKRSTAILTFLRKLAARSRALFIVSNDVGAEGTTDPLSRFWMRELAGLHAALGKTGSVIELAAGCPILLNQERTQA